MNGKQVTHYSDYDKTLGIEGTVAMTFAAIIMAAIRRADTDNLGKLVRAFPEIASDAFMRYFAPGGCISRKEWEEIHNNREELADDAYPTEVYFEEARKHAEKEIRRHLR